MQVRSHTTHSRLHSTTTHTHRVKSMIRGFYQNDVILRTKYSLQSILLVHSMQQICSVFDCKTATSHQNAHAHTQSSQLPSNS